MSLPKDEFIKFVEENYPECSIMHRMYIDYDERCTQPKEEKIMITENTIMWSEPKAAFSAKVKNSDSSEQKEIKGEE